jgi:hypothetical protein
LTVSGQLTAGGLSYPTSDGTNEQVLRTDGSGNLSFGTVSGTTLNNNTNNYVMTGTGTANTLNGESGLIFDGTNLGVATNNPDQLLQVGSESYGANAIIKTQVDGSDVGNFDSGLHMRSHDDNFGGSIILESRSGTNDIINFKYHNNSSAGVTAMAIDATNGNVGIGSTSPDELLTLRNADPTLLIQGNQVSGVHYSEIDFKNQAGSVLGKIGLSYYGGAAEFYRNVPTSWSHVWKVNNSERMRINSSGNVGINRTSPNGLLHMQSNSGTDSALYIQTSATSDDSIINFGDNGSSAVGKILYQHSSNSMQFNTQSSERMRIDSAGRVGIGTTNPDAPLHVEATNASLLLSNSGRTQYWRIQNYETSDDLVINANDTAERMRIDSNGTLLVGLNSRVWSGANFEVVNNARVGNIYLTGQSSDSTISAGNGTFKFSTLTATGGGTGLDFNVNIVVTGVGIANRFKVDSPTGDTYTNDGTISSLSDIRVKTDINDLTDGLEIVKQLRPVTFKYNDNSTDDDGNGMLAAADDKIRYGFIAQEVEEVAPHYVETSTRKISNEEVDDFKSLSTTRMIPMLFKAIQEQQTIIDDLKSRIETLEE